ncbi:3-oxo-isoapionate kinase [Paraburkholderia kirstenboschensis]|uniref:four-carbon acid sugar kinase family protein n=1 Tax=Paraburkholderia kirstenboschensis TaxID=1245436 RepID=UPI000AF2060B|nr:four-carbon acid sugar kinase family protein [Paraburkholderia kirstenboschensis]CAD6542459.1 3-oxo-isoapionate kinase [Paraburkholderia kirstenboschensis]
MNSHDDPKSSGETGGGPQYAFYGDDFTGATDTLAHLARAGLRTMLLLAPPDATHLGKLGPLDAIGVAGAARTMSPDQQRVELARVGQAFAKLGVRVMHYKVCSTFDSAPGTGSIGVAIRTLRNYCANPLVAVIGGQPNLGRYCVFGELYAAAGADDGESSIYRIDRHPTMSRHPVTPMNEADLRVHLQRQGVDNVQSIDWRCYAAGDAALQTELQRRLALRPDAVLFDVLDDSHLHAIGRLLAHQARSAAPLLAVGASSVAQAYASALGPSAASEAAPQRERLARARSPVFALAGSLSPLTEVQIRAAHSYRRIELDPLQMTGESAHGYLMAQVAAIADALGNGSNVLAFTSRREPGSIESPGALPQLAHACAALLRQVLDAVKLQRVGIAGGDTSSIAVRALGAWGLSYLAPLSAGVSVCRVHADSPQLDGIELMLKGGQMGEIDLFEKLLEGHDDNEHTGL